MAESGAQQVAELQQDLPCPQCEYNLRGLRGAVVQCPECGATFDVARLITRRWRGPWWKAPGFNGLVWPVAWAVGAGLALLIATAIAGSLAAEGGALWPLFALVFAGVGAVAVWARLLRGCWRAFDGLRGVQLSLLAHVIFAGYVAGSWGLLIGAIGLASRMRMGVVDLVAGALAAIILLGLLVVCRRGERYLAEQCIRRYLARTAGMTATPQ